MKHLPLDSKIYLSEDGVTEIEGPGYEDLRFFVIAMVDPFDLIGLAMGRHTTKEFWKEEPGRSKAVDEEAGGKEEDAETTAATVVPGEGAGIENEKAVIADENGNSSEPALERSKNLNPEGS